MSTTPAPLGTMSRAEEAAVAIGRLAEQREPGERLGSKKELQELTGVSKGTFNEAIRLLVARGLVSTRSGPGGGLFVKKSPPYARLGSSLLRLDSEGTEVQHAVRIRDALDLLTVEDALEHASAADVARMRVALADMRAALEAEDHLAFLHANWDLHAVIARTSPNVPLRSIYLGMLDVIRQHTVDVASGTEPLPDYVQQRYQLHAELVDALAARDADAARRLALLHGEKNETTASAPRR